MEKLFTYSRHLKRSHNIRYMFIVHHKRNRKKNIWHKNKQREQMKKKISQGIQVKILL